MRFPVAREAAARSRVRQTVFPGRGGFLGVPKAPSRPSKAKARTPPAKRSPRKAKSPSRPRASRPAPDAPDAGQGAEAVVPDSAFAPAPSAAAWTAHPASPESPPAPALAPPPSAVAPRRAVLPGAIAALVLGVVAVWMFPLGLVLGPLAIGFAIQARRRHRVEPGLQGRGLATAGLVTGIVGTLLGAGFVALFAFEDVLELGAEEDRGADIAAVQAGLFSRNLDADAAHELVVGVAAWDAGHEEPIRYAGRIDAVLESSQDGATWTPVANNSMEAEFQKGEYSLPVSHLGFEGVELDPASWYRVHVTVTAGATGARFQDETRPVAGDEMPDYFFPAGA